MTCSPCRIDMRTLGRAAPAASLSTVRWSRRWTAAAVLVAVGLTAWFLRGRSPNDTASLVAITSDLRPYAVTRSAQEPALSTPLTYPRGRLRVTLFLPTGSEPGAYDVRLLDAGRRPVASATAHAELRDFITRLSADLDLRSVASGAYSLAVRRAGGDWQVFPTRIE